MKTSSRPLPAWLQWMMRVLGVLLLVCCLWSLFIVSLALWLLAHSKAGLLARSGLLLAEDLGRFVGTLLLMYLGLWLLRRPGKGKAEEAKPKPAEEPAEAAALAFKPSRRPTSRRWSACNILRTDADANRLWQFEAKGGGFALNREHHGALDAPLPDRFVTKSWNSLWQPRLNVAWLPPGNVFLRVIELPKSNFEETFAMVELQLEKLSPLPVAQIVWTIHILSRRGDPPRQGEAGTEPLAAGEATGEDLQTVVVVIVERGAVEEYLGKLEGRGYFADRLEVPMLDQLEATPATRDGAWIYPVALAGQSAALVAWWRGNTLRNLSFVVLPPTGDRAKNLKAQLAQLVWAGELEGWLTAPILQWNLVADATAAPDWENVLREGLDEPVQVTPPLPPVELAARTAQRATAAGLHTALLPAEFPARYHQQFVDRLWLRGLLATGVLYAIGVVVYFCAAGVLAYRTHGVELQAAALSGSYTNVMELKARYDVLKERQDLKYAALDCWKVVAEQLPANITLQRFSFADGQKLTLSGTAPADQVNTLFDFNTAMQKVVNQDRPMFDSEGAEPVNPRTVGNRVTWNFSLQLQHAEELP